ncbi:hypothetical protein DPMN_045413 [Dreissena polymorpha]|uniref:Uncharacterized protein n=1 Tax=Dreissena polymorpha TaxID=45954 RepID=A0A9D4D661_DREPO|nr:hypothetical protein DPMN_045413 [Dreissena polymorpha]
MRYLSSDTNCMTTILQFLFQGVHISDKRNSMLKRRAMSRNVKSIVRLKPLHWKVVQLQPVMKWDPLKKHVLIWTFRVILPVINLIYHLQRVLKVQT